jgi:hypothetical protein
MSALGDAVKALRALILIEERGADHARKIETHSNQLVDLDRRLVRIETLLAVSMKGGLPQLEGPTK